MKREFLNQRDIWLHNYEAPADKQIDENEQILIIHKTCGRVFYIRSEATGTYGICSCWETGDEENAHILWMEKGDAKAAYLENRQRVRDFYFSKCENQDLKDQFNFFRLASKAGTTITLDGEVINIRKRMDELVDSMVRNGRNCHTYNTDYNIAMQDPTGQDLDNFLDMHS